VIALYVTLGGVAEAGLSYMVHHRTGLLTAVAGVVVWAARFTGLTRIPLFAAEAGKRGAHGKTRRELRKAAKVAKAARKVVTA
jgi:hypothetical protein